MSNVESIFPLLPNQRALLLAGGIQAEDPGFIQVTFSLSGPVDLTRYTAAWRSVLERHPGLRASIRTREDGDPLVVVWREVELPLELDDWRDRDDVERRRLWVELLEADRTRGLDAAAQPVMRLRVIRMEDERFDVLWTSHHMFVDGWSAAIVLEDVMDAYRALARGTVTPAAPGGDILASYVRWMTNSSDDEAERYWRSRLAGYEGAPAVALGKPDPAAPGYGELTRVIEPALLARVAQSCADLSVTPSAFVQTAWALLLGALLDTRDVVFGTTVAGRAVPIAGIERLVGYLANAAPIRVPIDPGRLLPDLLRGARDAQFAMQPHEHVPLASVHEWSDVPGHLNLFDTFLMVANYPFDEADAAPEGDVAHSDFDSGLTASFPLTVAAGLRDPGFVRCRFELARCTPQAAASIVDALIDTLDEMTDSSGREVGEVLAQVRGRIAALDVAAYSPAETIDRSRPAETDIERRLAAIMAQSLGLPAVGVDDDFFALGGTSIRAVRLFARIEDEVGTRLPLSALLSGATVAHLAALLGDERAPERTARNLVPIQTSGSEPPIACLHSATGQVLFYRSLAQRLGPKQPVYGLEPVGLDGDETPLESIPDMAALYVRELRSVQPQGPYRLVGYCFGCTVALEMARQLEAEGETLDLLGMIDPPRLRPETRKQRVERIRRSRGTAGLLFAAARKLLLVTGWRLRRHVGRRLDRAFGGAAGRRRLNEEHIRDACTRAANSYSAAPVASPIMLIRSNDDRHPTDDLPDQWREISPGLREAVVDTHHGGMLDDPTVDSVAEIISEEMTRARRP